MTVVRGVAVAVVHVVDVVAVRDGNVAAALAVIVLVAVVRDMLGGLTLVDVAVMRTMNVAVVGVVDVVAVRDRDMAAALTVLVVVVFVNGVRHGVTPQVADRIHSSMRITECIRPEATRQLRASPHLRAISPGAP